MFLIQKVCPFLNYDGCSNEINLRIALGKALQAVNILVVSCIVKHALAAILICFSASILFHSSWLVAIVSCTLS
jgi:hypothetical protein